MNVPGPSALIVLLCAAVQEVEEHSGKKGMLEAFYDNCMDCGYMEQLTGSVLSVRV